MYKTKSQLSTSPELNEEGRSFSLSTIADAQGCKALEAERKARKLETIPKAVRAVQGEYFKGKANTT